MLKLGTDREMLLTKKVSVAEVATQRLPNIAMRGWMDIVRHAERVVDVLSEPAGVAGGCAHLCQAFR